MRDLEPPQPTRVIQCNFNADGKGYTPVPFKTKEIHNRRIKDSIKWAIDCLTERELGLLKNITITEI